ncbi:ileal sodium/bile acid cotransporter-like [Acanthaster planci]|uniref:Ileal sodium/bile acid cotransporter-like n=1 Tax=Acanthaster planci TaxID=133434 RepID=A0A8B7ZHE1_ACAPL|nr:ileal sodium/bile acid cotransporter-like [Acanthaster planci]
MAFPSRIHVAVLLVSVWLAFALAQPSVNFTVSHDGDTDFLTVKEGQVLPLNITITNSVYSGIISVASTDEGTFEVVNATEYTIVNSSDLPLVMTVRVKGKFVGIERLRLRLAQTAGAVGVAVGEYTIKVIRVPTILDILFTYVLLVWLCLSYVTTGAKMQPKVIWSKMKPPWGILIGMLGQFILMPLWAFALTKIFALDNETALGLIFVGTCPGGWLSNIFSLLLDCDFVLSLTMTFCSTVMAMGLMPLNLFIYATPIVAENAQLKTPFVELAIQLILLVIPIGIGMALCYKFEKFKKICESLLKPLAGILILLALGLGISSQLYIFQSPWQVWVVSALLPIGGVILGGVSAKIVCLPKKSAITVALETGAQNALLAKTMLDLFYPRPESDLMGRVPLMVGLLGLIEGTVTTLTYVLILNTCCRMDEDQEVLVKDNNDNEKTEQDAEKADKQAESKQKEGQKAEEGVQTTFHVDSPADQVHVNLVFDSNEEIEHNL